MPVRAVLNVVYALMVKDAEPKEREQFDNELYGFVEANQSAMRVLMGPGESGSDDPETDAAPATGMSGVDD